MEKYVADRDFNEVRKGQVLELEDDHPYVKTGYLVSEKDVEEMAPEERPVVDEEPDPAADAAAEREEFEAAQLMNDEELDDEEPETVETKVSRRRASRKASTDADEGAAGA